jgi:hypothetical protein
MTGRSAVETLLAMADRRVNAIKVREAERRSPDHHLRREVAALRCALIFMNTPRDILPTVPPLPDHLRRPL